jgi:DNA transposition AAA+ family ATPase
MIIDHADYLGNSALELLRCISVDMTNVGLVLVGLPRLEQQLRNLPNGHEQLLSRERNIFLNATALSLG